MIICEGFPIRIESLRQCLKRRSRQRGQVVVVAESSRDADVLRALVAQAKKVDLRPPGSDKTRPVGHVYLGTPGKDFTIAIFDADHLPNRDGNAA
jgi:hypothetical protein